MKRNMELRMDKA